MRQIKKLGLLIGLLAGGFVLWTQTAAAQTERTASCYLYEDGQLVRSGRSGFLECAEAISAEADSIQQYSVGAWSRSYVIINEEGDVYYRSGRTWRYWDTLERQSEMQPSADDLDGDGVLNDADQCADEPETVNGVFDTDGCPDDIMDLLNFATSDLNNFWQNAFDEADLAYRAPTQVSAYRGNSRTSYNAYYSSYSHSIHYDIRLMEDGLEQLGDVAPVFIMAHEFGHLVQSNLRVLNNGRYTIQTELEADCLAGAYLKDLNERGLLDEGDAEEGMRQAYQVGDSLPWYADGAHGSPEQRAEAYTLGFENGASTCFTSFEI